ncbi:triose-phosphate isomerase [Candidatus Falkowbacteria bacterium]|nr:triose-phosphate isomerase [Candidatus Falkowbacteria bacterium]
MDKNRIIIANWKMKMGLEETGDLTKEILDGLKELEDNDLPETVLCPSYIAIAEAGKVLGSGNKIKLGSQDVFWEEKGAYTGEISVEMIKELGCEYVIVGHSERRGFLGETDEMVNKKIKMILNAGLVPILCVGETGEERNQGKKDYRVTEQLEQALRDVKLTRDQEVIVVYEPVWVIGIGQAVETEDVKYMSNLIKHIALDYSINKEGLRVIYGGSADSGNVSDLMQNGGVEGFLVGTAALDANEFLGMIKLMSN